MIRLRDKEQATTWRLSVVLLAAALVAACGGGTAIAAAKPSVPPGPVTKYRNMLAGQTAGAPIDLSEPTAKLDVRLVELLHREAQLDGLGVGCELKERSDVLCSLCPVSQASDENAPLGALCRVGREMESVCTQLAVARGRTV